MDASVVDGCWDEDNVPTKGPEEGETAKGIVYANEDGFVEAGGPELVVVAYREYEGSAA
jgi:hypothetical protein